MPLYVTSRSATFSYTANAKDAADALQKLSAIEKAGYPNCSCIDHSGRAYTPADLESLIASEVKLQPVQSWADAV